MPPWCPSDEHEPSPVTGLLLIPVIELGQIINLIAEGIQGHTTIPLELLHLTYLWLRPDRNLIGSCVLWRTILIPPKLVSGFWLLGYLIRHASRQTIHLHPFPYLDGQGWGVVPLCEEEHQDPGDSYCHLTYHHTEGQVTLWACL